MRLTRILIVVAGSAWFFPVSCMTSLSAGVQIAAALDARDVTEGDSLHSQFSMVMESGNNDEPFHVVDLYGLRRIEKSLQYSDTADAVSFLMSKPSGQLDWGTSSFSYQVIEETDSEQLIEVVEAYHDGDNTIWSRYKATRSTITPVSSRMFYFGYMFAAFPFALAFAFLIYGTGQYFRRKHQKAALVPSEP
jgi:hypothetical protein